MTHSQKITTIDDLVGRIATLRAESKTVIHCHGVFDLLHIGHIRYLQKAKTLADVLVVTLTPDRFVNKGPHRPAFDERLRADALAAIDGVDFVAINNWPTATEAIERLKPDIYAKGAEFRDRKTPELLEEERIAATVGARIEFIEEITSSSSHLINTYLSPFTEEVEHYLRQLRQAHSADAILGHLQRIRPLKVLVVGEAIIDEYYACATLGRSTKAPIVATRYESHERFAGGALAVANHVAGFCDQVSLISLRGTENSEEDWIRTRLRPNVTASFISKQDAPTIVKRQYRESYFGIPLFEMNSLSDKPLSEAEEAALCDLLDRELGGYDLVLAADYGYTMLTESAVRLLCDRSKYLAVSTQANAANVGFHTIGRYDRADYVSLAEQELRLECRRRSGDLHEMLQAAAQRLLASTVAVTIGKRGCLCYNEAETWHEAPALATKVVDRFGAGDAFFAITSLAAAAGVPTDVLAFLGNVAGAEVVATLGNSRFLEELPFRRHIESLLK